MHTAHIHRPGRIFARLVITFGAFVALVAGALWLLVSLVQMALNTGHAIEKSYVLIGIGIVLLVGLAALATHLGRRTFKTVASPLAGLLSAAEAVKNGDLSARISETNSRHFNSVVNTFNEMIASLERADQQRRNLTADVAHELRTPLQIIQGNLEGILDGVYEPTPEHIEATLEATHQLARLVEDLRTLSLAESGQLTLELKPVDVAELLLDTQTSFSGLAESSGVTLRVATPGEPLIVHGDPGRLDQVMGNLVVNAVRHTPREGVISLEASAHPDGVEIRVGDTGEGIAPEDLPFIFDRFWRGDRARGHQTGAGSGLGLAITRQLVRLHGGTIDVASTPGAGTTFTISLPAAPTA
ncbi:MAG: HAMP domain-containing histidine kinase [Anaerolineae bacterium]|nr:HAMP domain-containing histidine kinase [Anaerolineae bacterium]